MITKQAKLHFYISLFKSVYRILACVGLMLDQSQKTIALAAFGFLMAEVLGIAEEIFDKR